MEEEVGDIEGEQRRYPAWAPETYISASSRIHSPCKWCGSTETLGEIISSIDYCAPCGYERPKMQINYKYDKVAIDERTAKEAS